MTSAVLQVGQRETQSATHLANLPPLSSASDL